MSGCERFAGELSAYLDRELAAELRAEFEQHLPGCASCRSALESQQWLDRELAALPRLEPSPQFEARFWARLARAAEQPRSLRERLEGWLARPRLSWAVGPAALLVLAIWLSFNSGSGLPSDEWEIVADAEQFELLQNDDLELLAALDVLEGWDGAEEI